MDDGGSGEGESQCTPPPVVDVTVGGSRDAGAGATGVILLGVAMLELVRREVVGVVPVGVGWPRPPLVVFLVVVRGLDRTTCCWGWVTGCLC